MNQALTLLFILTIFSCSKEYNSDSKQSHDLVDREKTGEDSDTQADDQTKEQEIRRQYQENIEYLIEVGYCEDVADCEKKVGTLPETFTGVFDLPKREYCCVSEFRSSRFEDPWHKCRGFREWKHEGGRFLARGRCTGWNISWGSSDGFGVGPLGGLLGWSEVDGRKLLAKSCSQVYECNTRE